PEQGDGGGDREDRGGRSDREAETDARRVRDAERPEERDTPAGERRAACAAGDVDDVLEDEGALRARLPRAAPEGSLHTDPEEPHSGAVYERSRDERSACMRGQKQEVAGGDRGKPGHDALFPAAQREREERAEREGDRVRAEQAAGERRAAVLGEHEQGESDGEVRIRDPRAERRGDE